LILAGQIGSICRMKIAGILSILTGVVAAILLSLTPTHVTLLGSEIDCGIPPPR